MPKRREGRRFVTQPRFTALLSSALAVVLSGCADRDAVMGRTAGTPVPEPVQNSVHCDLIFPGTDRR